MAKSLNHVGMSADKYRTFFANNVVPVIPSPILDKSKNYEIENMLPLEPSALRIMGPLPDTLPTGLENTDGIESNSLVSFNLCTIF